MKELVKSVYLLNFFKNHPLISLLFSDLPKNECVSHREVSFKANHHAAPKNSVRYKSIRYMEGLLREFDRDSADS